MTLFQIVDILKKIALDQPNIRTTTDGSIYDVLNTNPSVQYDVVHFTQTTHQSDEEWDYYGFNIFYVSRLEDSLEDNRLQIQSIGKEILDNILRTFCENWSIEFPTITYTPFTQKFNDLTAGVYCNVRLEVPKELICADDYTAEVVPGSGIKLQDMGITITQNGLIVITPDAEYDGIGEIRIETNVPQSAAVLQDKEVEYTENGSYSIHPDPAYDGLSSVSVDVLVPDNYDEGYEDGYGDGEAHQKGLLSTIEFNENGFYERGNGWSAVTVDVPDHYEEGLEDGAFLQKQKMVATALTANGIYTREDGYSAITVNVPQTGGTDADLIANLQGDYFLIPDGTTHLRNYAFYGACFSSITIPASVSAIGSSSFDYNSCLRRITLPDSVLTLGNAAFQYCINLETVILSNSLTTLKNATFNNCRSLTGITIPSGITSIEALCFNNCSGLTEMTFEGLVPPTINTGNSLGSTAYTFPIYVPCESIDAYKTAFGSYYAPRIQCINAATSLTINVESAITDSGQATVTVNPSGANTNITFTSSDDTIATIDDNGNITVISDGEVTFCAYDSISDLQDCKTVTVSKTPEYISAITFTVPSAITDSATTSVSYEPASATTNITYTSSDTSKATIDANGVITVLASGTVTFCAVDTLSNLSDCKTATVSKTEPQPVDYSAMPLTFEILSAGTIVFGRAFNSCCTGQTPNTPDAVISYSKNNGSYITIATSASSSTTINVQAGDIIKWRGTNTYFRNSVDHIGFEGSTAVFNAYGNTMSVLYGSNFTNKTTLKDNLHSTFGDFFTKTKIVNAENLILPATTLGETCYSYMFRDCTLLVSAPSLPAMTMQIESYAYMFVGCKSLTTAPALPATTLAGGCYRGMFSSCSSLSAAPVLPATTTIGGCYAHMFERCLSLTKAPALPATTLSNMCYDSMFANCSNLTGAPSLPAGTLKADCYSGMFKGCTSLTTAPRLAAKTLQVRCYRYMFSGCTKLNYIYCTANNATANQCTYRWVTGVASSGTFVKNASMGTTPIPGGYYWNRGENGIPTGWTVEDAS